VLHCYRGVSEDADEVLDGVQVHRRRTFHLPGTDRLRTLRTYAALKWHLGQILHGPHYPRDRLLGRLNGALSTYVAYRRLGLQFDAVETAEYGAASLLLSVMRSEPLVMQFHCPPVLDLIRSGAHGVRWRLAGAIERVPMRRADVRTSPSQLLIDEMADLGYLRDVDIDVIPLPFRADEVPSRVAETAPVILGVGRIDPAKGWHRLIEAVGLLVDDVPGVKVVLVGGTVGSSNGDSYHDTLIRLAREWRVPLELVGSVPHDQMPQLYAGCRVVAITSDFENFSMAGLEALSSGRPLVTTARLGYAREIEAAGAASVVAEHDAVGYANALRPLLLDAGAAAEMGGRGRAWVVDRLDPARIAALREEAYRAAARRHGRRTISSDGYVAG
jgi:glycosyltransferase involved in cell wall biosynthesis